MIKTKDLYSFDHSLAGAYLKQFEYPWQALKGIGDLIKTLSKDLSKDDYEEKKPGVFVHKTARIYPNTYLGAPCIIGANTEVRPGAFIRGNALVGEDCVVGNSTELKNVILFDHVQVPHYNYVGDSILGYYSHMGAGSITSNVKSDKTLVVVKDKDEEIKTGLKKMGAMLGDHVEVGCNSVLNPGTIIGKGTSIYPLSCVRHVVPAGMIYKDKDHITKRDDKHWSVMLIRVQCENIESTSIYPLSCVRHVVPAGMIYKDKDHITKRDDKHWSVMLIRVQCENIESRREGRIGQA